MKILSSLKPEKVFNFFEEISAIPRGSKNEEQISEYLLNFGKSRGLETIQDKALNIIIKKDATPGYETIPAIIIQGHMDMVWEKNLDTEFDFENEGLKLLIDGDFIKAKGTTLGADNGIAVAFALTILDSNDIPHPKLEVLLTSDEETGMSGAMALDGSLLEGKYLFNIDTEEEGEIYVSCSGGNRTTFTIPVTYTDTILESFYNISIRGLFGGHSGMEIQLQRGNSNKIMGRILKAISDKLTINLIEINGGSKTNAIPREGDALISVAKKDIKILNEIVADVTKNIIEELRVSDAGVKISITEAKETKPPKVMDSDTTNRVINTLFLYPNGVQRMSLDIEGLVETSLNLGVLTTEDKGVVLQSAIRSSVDAAKALLTKEVETLAVITGAKFEQGASYPAWKFNPNSKLQDMALEVHEKSTGKKAGIKAIHAGLECGLLGEKLPDCDMISFGPNMFDVHTPEEKLSISSVENVWSFLLDLLKSSKDYL
jgi:dipeptidase D